MITGENLAHRTEQQGVSGSGTPMPVLISRIMLHYLGLRGRHKVTRREKRLQEQATQQQKKISTKESAQNCDSKEL